MLARVATFAVTVLVGLTGTGVARAACNIPAPQYLDTVASFDSHYSAIGFPDWNSSSETGSNFCCDQHWMNMVWDRWTFASATWDGNMGRTDACNSNKPVARMFHGLYALLYSARQYAQTWGDTSTGTVLQWGGTWSARWTVATSGVCAFGVSYSAAAYDTHTEHTLNIPYIKTVPERAGTFLHESVHTYGFPHDRSGSRDSRWNAGAWTYHTQWQFEYAALGVRNTQAMRKRAADDASRIKNNYFAEEPFFAIYYRRSNGTFQNVDCPDGCSYNTGNDLFLNNWGFVSRSE